MKEVIVVSHLLVMGLVSLIMSTIFTTMIAAFSSFVVVLSGIFTATDLIDRNLLIAVCAIYSVIFLFNIAYSVVSVIGSILGSMQNNNMRKSGFIVLIVLNVIMIPFFVASCAVINKWYELYNSSRSDLLFRTIAGLGIATSACQVILFVYNIIHIIVIVITVNFRNVTERISNRSLN